MVVFVLSLLVFVWLRSLPGGPVSAILGERRPPSAGPPWRRRSASTSRCPCSTPSSWSARSRATSASRPRCCPARTPSTSSSTRLPATIELSFLALLLAIALGIPLGYIAARRHGSPVDTGAVIFSLVGVAVPVFFLAFLLKYCFAVEWNLLPGLRAAEHRRSTPPG